MSNVHLVFFRSWEIKHLSVDPSVPWKFMLNIVEHVFDLRKKGHRLCALKNGKMLQEDDWAPFLASMTASNPHARIPIVVYSELAPKGQIAPIVTRVHRRHFTEVDSEGRPLSPKAKPDEVEGEYKQLTLRLHFGTEAWSIGVRSTGKWDDFKLYVDAQFGLTRKGDRFVGIRVDWTIRGPEEWARFLKEYAGTGPEIEAQVVVDDAPGPSTVDASKRTIRLVFHHPNFYEGKCVPTTRDIPWDAMEVLASIFLGLKERKQCVEAVEHGRLLHREDWPHFMASFKGDRLNLVVHLKDKPVDWKPIHLKGKWHETAKLANRLISMFGGTKESSDDTLQFHLCYQGSAWRILYLDRRTSWKTMVDLVDALYALSDQGQRLKAFEQMYSPALTESRWVERLSDTEIVGDQGVVLTEAIPAPTDPKPLGEVALTLRFRDQERTIKTLPRVGWESMQESIGKMFDLSEQGDMSEQRMRKIGFSHEGRPVYAQEEWEAFVQEFDGKHVCVQVDFLPQPETPSTSDRADASTPPATKAPYHVVVCHAYSEPPRSRRIVVDSDMSWEDMKEVLDTVFDLKRKGMRVTSVTSWSNSIRNQEDWDLFLEREDGKSATLHIVSGRISQVEEPIGKEPKGKEPKGKEPKGKEPIGKEPKGKDVDVGAETSPSLRFVLYHTFPFETRTIEVAPTIEWDVLVCIVDHVFDLCSKDREVYELSHGKPLKEKNWPEFRDGLVSRGVTRIPLIIRSTRNTFRKPPLLRLSPENRKLFMLVESKLPQTGYQLTIGMVHGRRMLNVVVNSAVSWEDFKDSMDARYGLTEKGERIFAFRHGDEWTIDREEQWKLFLHRFAGDNRQTLTAILTAPVKKPVLELKPSGGHVEITFAFGVLRRVVSACPGYAWTHLRCTLDNLFDLGERDEYFGGFTHDKGGVTGQEEWDAFLREFAGQAVHAKLVAFPAVDLSTLTASPTSDNIYTIHVGKPAPACAPPDPDKGDGAPPPPAEAAGGPRPPLSSSEEEGPMTTDDFGDEPTCRFDWSRSAEGRLQRSERRVVTMESRLDRLEHVVDEVARRLAETRITPVEEWIRGVAYYIHSKMDRRRGYILSSIWHLVDQHAGKKVPLEMIDRALAYGVRHKLFRIKVGDVLVYERIEPVLKNRDYTNAK